MYQNLFDSHMHTNHSPDGADTALALCNQALAKNFLGIAITDHCEINAFKTGGFDKKIYNSANAIFLANEKMEHRLSVHTGIELGQPLHNLSHADEALSLADFDFVLCSVHNVQQYPDFYFMNYKDPTVCIDSLLNVYFEEVLQTVIWNQFDSLAHLTYPIRYITGVQKVPVSISNHYAIIDKIFEKLIQNNKSLEINTSGLRQPLGETMPNTDLLTRYYALGGRNITIGSDAHRANDVGMHVEVAMDIAKTIGFSHVNFYKKRVANAFHLA